MKRLIFGLVAIAALPLNVNAQCDQSARDAAVAEYQASVLDRDAAEVDEYDAQDAYLACQDTIADAEYEGYFTPSEIQAWQDELDALSLTASDIAMGGIWTTNAEGEIANAMTDMVNADAFDWVGNCAAATTHWGYAEDHYVLAGGLYNSAESCFDDATSDFEALEQRIQDAIDHVFDTGGGGCYPGGY